MTMTGRSNWRTDPAFVVRLWGKLKFVESAVGPLGGASFEIDDSTCVIVLEVDGTFGRGRRVGKDQKPG